MTYKDALKAARAEVVIRKSDINAGYTVITTRNHPKDKKADRQETRQWCETYPEAQAFRATRVITRALRYLGIPEGIAAPLAKQTEGRPPKRIRQALAIYKDNLQMPLPFMEDSQ